MSPTPTTSPTVTEQLFDSGDAYFDGLIADINQARKHIDLECYIFARDTIGDAVADALIEAHHRGVAVRVLLDGVGSWRAGDYYAERLEAVGIEVKIFHPLPWQIHHYRRALLRDTWVNKLVYFFRRINNRDHRKLCIIDQDRFWTGSFNICADHISVAAGGAGWRDYGLRVTGPLVADIQQDFDRLWNRRRPRPSKSLFQSYWSNFTLRARRRKSRFLIKRILQAKNRVWIVSAYFAPSIRVVRGLRKASKRGVDVRLVVPAKSDHQLSRALTSTYYADLLAGGVKVYEYQPAMIHAKALILDDLHIIGSTNFNHRSFLHDLELDVALQEPDSQQKLQQWLRREMSESIALDAASSRQRLLRRLFGWFAILLRYWM